MLGLQWQWHGNHEASFYSLTHRPGWLSLNARPLGADAEGNTFGPIKAPHLVAQKFPAKEFSAETLLDASGLADGGIAGLTIVGGGHSAWLAVAREGTDWKLLYLLDTGERQELALLSQPTAHLRVSVGADATCRFSFATAGDFLPVEPAFIAGEGGWIGAKVGLIATGNGGHADFDHVLFS